MILLGSTRFLANYDAGFKIISFGPKGSIEKTFFNKGYCTGEKTVLAPFFSNHRLWQTKSIFFWTPEGNLSIMVQDLRSFL